MKKRIKAPERCNRPAKWTTANGYRVCGRCLTLVPGVAFEQHDGDETCDRPTDGLDAAGIDVEKRREALAQLGARVLEILAKAPTIREEMTEAGALDFQLNVRSDVALLVHSAARSLGLLGEAERHSKGSEAPETGLLGEEAKP